MRAVRAEDCIVVGGGITGLAAAHALAGHGLRVALLERATIGAMASGRTLGGVRQSGRDPAELPLARAAVARWASLADELGADTGYRRSGNL
ncbi:MAG: FAD-binding oxidoreductase, partial [Elioraea sp.]|nr:FAD-binding oxidoreductase [Elioraea sp.]